MPVKCYKKKPVVIEAIQYQPHQNCTEVADFMGLDFYKGSYCGSSIWIIPTLEGDMEASPGDWIIKGTHGEFYPCKDHIFRANYEEVTNV